MIYFYRLAHFTLSTKFVLQHSPPFFHINITTGALTTRNKRYAHYHLVTWLSH